MKSTGRGRGGSPRLAGRLLIAVMASAVLSATRSLAADTVFTGQQTASGQLSAQQFDRILFYDQSSAGTSIIDNGGTVNFYNNSTAGNAFIFNRHMFGAGTVTFYDNSSAGNATLPSQGYLIFTGNSTAANSIINRTFEAFSFEFRENSTAGNATIASAFPLYFKDNATAGNAQIENGSEIYFSGNSNAGNAAITNTYMRMGTYPLVDFSGTSGPNGNGKVSLGSISGIGVVNLGSNELTIGGNNRSTTFSGVFGGSAGSLVKVGTGTLTLTEFSLYTGNTTIQEGTLEVNGGISSSNVIVNGGTLSGSGQIGYLPYNANGSNVYVNAGGTIAPGSSIGTLTINGNITFATGSAYQVEVNASGQGDRLNVTGSATIAGGTVQVLAENGNYSESTSYTILTASGGVSGTFSNVTSNLAFLTPSLSYGGQDVILSMSRNGFTFASIAQSANQAGIARAAEALGGGNSIYNALIGATAGEARGGFNLLSGEAHAQAVGVMIDQSRLVRETILGHLRGPLLTAPASQVAASFSADLPGRKGAIVMPAPVPQPRYALWGNAFGGTGTTDSNANAASLSRRSGGALLGADFMVYDAPRSALKLGVAGGYSQSRFDLDARLSSGRLDSGHVALYADARFGQLRLDAGAAYSWSESDIRRQVQIRGFGDLLRLQRSGSVTQGFAELGYAFAFSGFALEPFAQLALIRVSTNAGTERGGAAALRVFGSDQTLGFTTLGLRAEAQIGAMPLFARAMLGWRHGFGDLTPQASTAFVAGTTLARVFAAPIDREALVAEAGLDWRISQAATLGLTYFAAVGERSRDHALKGRVELRF